MTYLIDATGWCRSAQKIPSPNYDARPVNTIIDMLVLHHISLPPLQFGTGDVAAFFTNTLDPQKHPFFAQIHKMTVSAHFFITRAGGLVQFVSCHDRAWHAGVSQWQGRTQCNDFSIGIELEGHEYTSYTESQYETLQALIPALQVCYPLQHFVGHQDIAPLRKTDPGPFFDWKRLYRLAVK
jgi:AmpD protein